ncbi:MAG: hypothetical protein Q7T80_17270 [Methanoregula sp.]|nr:hypothetical protein [Methanoregula sp.]
MNLTDRRLWEKIVVAVSCVIIVTAVATNIISPWWGVPIGICGPDTIPMNYSTEILPTFEMSFLHEFGESEPDRNLTLPPLMLYEQKQQSIDTLMAQAHIDGPPNSIIGLYEFPDARLLLIDQNTSITEVLGTGEKIQTFSLTPVIVGNRHYVSNETAGLQHGAYNFSYEDSVAITRIDLILPPQGNMTHSLYIVNKTHTEHDLYPDGRSLAAVTTTGRFYVIYGQRVERVIGTSAIILDPAWKPCSPRTEISGEGREEGEMKYTIKLARSSERMLKARLITTGAYIQVVEGNMGSGSQWKSRDSTGCTC